MSTTILFNSQNFPCVSGNANNVPKTFFFPLATVYRHSGLIPLASFKFFVLLVVKMAGQTSHGYAFSIFANASQHPYTKQASFSMLWVVSPVHISPGPFADIKQRIPCLRSPCECWRGTLFQSLGQCLSFFDLFVWSNAPFWKISTQVTKVY